MALHVFVEGPTDRSPAGLSRLAEAIGRHYGLPAADLLARLQKGRFRVKGNTDRETAEQYVRDLERLGAVCTIEEATADNSQRSTPLPFPAVRPATPPAGTATVPRATGTTTPPTSTTRAASTSLPPANSVLPPRTAGTTTPPTNSVLPPRTAGTSTPPTNSALPPRAASTSLPPTNSVLPPRAASSSLPPTNSVLPPRAANTSLPPTNSVLPPRAAGTTTPPTNSVLPPRAGGTTTPPAAAAGSRPSTPPPVAGFASGLAAAFSSEVPIASLGALESDSPAFALATVDGNDSSGPVSAPVFEPEQGGLPASIGPAPVKSAAQVAAAAAKAAKPKDEPLDLFAPPEQQGEEFKVNIAADEVETSARKRASTPPPMQPLADVATRGDEPPVARVSQPQTRRSQPSLQVPNVAGGGGAGGGVAMQGGVSAPSSSRLGALGDERVRYVAGVLLAVVLGFVPAHVVAGMREDSAYAEIDRKVIIAQQQADTPEAYALLDGMRADQLERKEAERRNAAIIAIVIWGIVGGGIAFAWFRKIPWDSFE